MKEKQAREREERERLRQEKLQKQISERLPDDYEERKRIIEEEVRAAQQRYQETFMQAEIKYRERIKKLEEELNERKEHLRQAAPVPRMPTKATQGAFAAASQILQTDVLLQQLRAANPEWEMRRQAALKVSHCGMIYIRTLLTSPSSASGRADERLEQYLR